jgi:O-antigen biosynthesis protein
MDLSIVIVNYNVKFFLEQCLHSVLKASEKINTEIFVVDNNSSDGSVAMLRKRFPEIILIENKSNVGFSVANNQALSISRGRYCLVLNPDTLVEEDTFIKCIHFMDAHPEAGALGVKMIDGKGVFCQNRSAHYLHRMLLFLKSSVCLACFLTLNFSENIIWAFSIKTKHI